MPKGKARILPFVLPRAPLPPKGEQVHRDKRKILPRKAKHRVKPGEE